MARDFTQDPIRYNIYKGKAAAQFGLARFNPARVRSSGKSSPNGWVMLEVAKVKGKNDAGNRIYDWERKITFGMSADDLSRFQVFSRKGGKIFHEYNGNTKTLELSPGNEDRDGLPTWMMTLSVKPQGGEWDRVTVSISAVEMTTLKSLFQAAVPSMLGWSVWMEPTNV